MGADKTNNIMTLSSGVSQSLLADVQYFELYSSLALNRKLKNIVLPGFYCGFEPVPGTGLSVRITSENSEGKGAASVDVNNVQISVQQIEDVTVSVKAGATNIIVLEANFEHGVKTTQVDSASSVSAARIYARTDNTIGQNQIELCRVIVPSGATAVTKEMIVLKYRVNRAVGVEFSNEISSTEERKAATPKAVKAAYDLANGKQPADATLTALAGLATAADRLPYFTGADRAALATLTAIGRAIIAKGSIKDVLNYLGLGEGSALPVGVPVPWPTATPPAGWLKCDGRTFTKEQYPVLARVYPTLRLPDLRGEFIRGWDDGRKVDTGRDLLSRQDGTSFSHYAGNFDIGSGHAINNYDQIVDNHPGFSRFSFAGPSRGDGVNLVTIRPRNIAFNYIVRAA
ncbi:TPA: tail fiber protein [Escherichia coli]|nr:tail fiber protein [Escherichia coli]